MKRDPEKTTYYSRSSRSVCQCRRLGAQKQKRRGYNHRSRRWVSSIAGSYAPNRAPHVLRKRNLLMVRLERNLLPEPTAPLSHNNLEPPQLCCQLKASWPGSTLWAPRKLLRDKARQDSLPGLPSCHLSSPSMPLCPTQATNMLAFHPPKMPTSQAAARPSSRVFSLGTQSW